MTLCRTSFLNQDDIDWVRRFLADSPFFRSYFEGALEGLRAGADNRYVHIGRDRQGVILGFDFDGLTAFSPVGRLRDQELRLLAACPQRLELQLASSDAPMMRALLGERIEMTLDQRLYERRTAGATWFPEARRLGPADLAAVSLFSRVHNPHTVFSAWMLELPFLAATDGDGIVATAGTLARTGDEAVIGNVVTRADRRGRGHARRLVESLCALLAREGVATVHLLTTSDNAPACAVYDAAGFAVAGRFCQMDVRPA